MQNNDGPFYLVVKGRPVRVEKQVFADSQKFQRKERHFYELKHGKVVFDPEKHCFTFIPPKEISLEQLIENGYQFEEPLAEPMEENLIREDLLELLHEALLSLTDEEWSLVQELYYLGKTEREVGKSLNTSKSTIQRRKDAILRKMKNFIERFF